MSRVGKKPVSVPSGVTANVSGTTINVKGPKGNLSLVFDDRVAVALDKGEIKVDPKDESKMARALWGTTRANLNNIMTGVTKGFERKLEIELKYFDGTPVIREISRVSKPGRRVYVAVKNLPRVNNGLGISILSTPKGVMADHSARDANVGGELLCTVF